jgi:hypothetical protein
MNDQGNQQWTAGMRRGFVRLKLGGAVGWHTTGQSVKSNNCRVLS